MKKWVRNYFLKMTTSGYVRELLALTIVLSALGFFWPEKFWLFDVAGHFVFHYALFSLVALVWFVYKRRWLWVFLAILTAGFNLWRMAPLPHLPSSCTLPQPLTVVTSNLLYHNKDVDSIVQALRAQKPDLIGVVEMKPAMRNEMREKLVPEYRYVQYPDSWSAGAGLWSRYPVLDMGVRWIGEWRTPYLWADIVLPDETTLRVYVLHAWSPGPYGRTAIRDDYLHDIGGIIGRFPKGRPVIVMGDFNITRFLPAFQDMVREGGLNDPAPFVPMGTWPSLFHRLGVQIDHILTKCIDEPRVSAFTVPGSDHRALKAVFESQ